LHLIALGEALEPGRLDRGEVNEDVRSPLPADEAKPLGVIEPFHGAGHASHAARTSLLVRRGDDGALARGPRDPSQLPVFDQPRRGAMWSHPMRQISCTSVRETTRRGPRTKKGPHAGSVGASPCA